MKQLANRDVDIERILLLEEKFLTDPLSWVGYLRRERARSDWEYSMNKQLIPI